MMAHHRATRRNSTGGGSSSLSGHHVNSVKHKGVVSLGATLDAGRRAAPLGNKEDTHSVSISSGYTADPTDFTERSMSSSVWLGETGQVMVSPKHGRKTPTILPPPPFSEVEAEVQEVPRKPKSCRRRSMFGSTPAPAADPIPKPRTDISSSSMMVAKPRRRSFFGSGTNIDYDLPQQVVSDFIPAQTENDVTEDIHDEINDLSPAKPRSTVSNFSVSSRSFVTEVADENNAKNNRSASSHKSSIRGKKFVKALFSPHHKKKSNREKSGPYEGSHDFTVDSQPTAELEVPSQEEEPPKKPRSRRRHSLFGNAGGTSRVTQEGMAPSSRPPPTPNHARRLRRSLFGNASGGNQEGIDAGAGSCDSDSPSRSEKTSLRRLLAKGFETTTATLTPRTNNPYELVNNERIHRHLPPFVRSMLLDSVAKDVAMQLSRSNGAKCRPTDYHGNIGKGVDIWTIHEKMMAQKGTEKANIISSHFYQYGIGMARDRDGQIYLCQLFQ